MIALLLGSPKLYQYYKSVNRISNKAIHMDPKVNV